MMYAFTIQFIQERESWVYDGSVVVLERKKDFGMPCLLPQQRESPLSSMFFRHHGDAVGARPHHSSYVIPDDDRSAIIVQSKPYYQSRYQLNRPYPQSFGSRVDVVPPEQLIRLRGA